MKEYNKEKLHEYAKELFALCLDKGIMLSLSESGNISVYKTLHNDLKHIGDCYLIQDLYDYSSSYAMPIWELIEKVKQL